MIKRGTFSLSPRLNFGVAESLIRLFVLGANGVFYIFLRTYFIGEALSVGHEVFR